MLTPPAFVIPSQNTKIIDELRNLSLTTGLVLCLDAGDGTSYDGTSQTWTDVSGSGNNFYRGGGSGSESSDPTFHGTADARSVNEYFSGDGGDAFWQTGAQTFMNAWHKDNATFTVAGWFWLPSGGTQGPNFLRNFRDTTDIGMAVAVTSAGILLVGAVNGSSLQQLTSPTLTVGTNQWAFVAVSFSEGSGASFCHYNGTSELFSSDTYTSPSASTATNGNSVWAAPDLAGTALETTSAPSNGCREANLIAWSRALSQTEIRSLFTATRTKFGV